MIGTPLLICTGLASGFLSGLLGVGGGIIIVPALILLGGIAPHKAIGISLAVIVPAAVTGAFRHHLSGNVDWSMALILALGAVAGGFCGASVASHVQAETLRRVFAVFLIIMGINMLVSKSSLPGRTADAQSAATPAQSTGSE